MSNAPETTAAEFTALLDVGESAPGHFTGIRCTLDVEVKMKEGT